MPYVGHVPIFVTGRRKPTSVFCPPCGAWHDTDRGLDPRVCPLDRPDSIVTPADLRAHQAESPQPVAFIPRTRLGDVHRARVRVPIRPDGTTGTPVVTSAR